MTDGYVGNDSRPRSLKRAALSSGMEWKSRIIRLPLARVAEDEKYYLCIICDSSQSIARKYGAATKLYRLRNGVDEYPFRIILLKLSAFNILFLPAELVVDYQIYAKSHCREPLAVAAYGDGFFKYIATEEDFAEGGYEVEPWTTEVGPEAEAIICVALKQMLS